MFRMTVEDVGVLFSDVDAAQLRRGDVITSSGEAAPLESATIIV